MKTKFGNAILNNKGYYQIKFSSVNLQTLRDKVIAKGLLWYESNPTETAGRTV